MSQLITILCTLVLAVNVVVALEYYIHDDKAFKVFPEKLNHSNAVRNCSEQGMELISLPTERIQNVIVQLMKMYGLTHSWTSGTDFEVPGIFKWVGYTLPSDSEIYTNWYTGYPKVVANGSAIIIASSLTYKWYSDKANNVFPFICITDLDIFLSTKCSKRISLLRMLGEYQQ